MFRNNLILALRIIRKDLFFSLIIVIGLSVSYSFFHMLWQYAGQELRSDRNHPGSERIYRLFYNWRYSDDGIIFKDANWGPHLFTAAPWFKSRYPEVDDYTRILNQPSFSAGQNGHGSNVYLLYETEQDRRIAFKEEHTAYADANLFSFFDLPLVQGDPLSVLADANTIVLSESIAKKYFGNVDPIGKTLLLNDKFSVKVTGIFRDLPSSTHLNFDIVMSNRRFADTWTAHNWTGQAHNYIRLKEKTSLDNFTAKMLKDNKQFWSTMNFKETATLGLQPLHEMAFQDGYVSDNFRVKSRSILLILKAIGIFLLLMGWINYINLTFSRVMKRVKELGTRKTFGAGYVDFFLQFLCETIVLNLVAVLLAIIIGVSFFGVIGTYTHIPLPDLSLSAELVMVYFVIILSGCLLTALYPALLGHSFTIRTLYAANTRGPGGGRLLISGITIFQYGISVVLIIWVLVMNLQMNYLLSAGTGMDKQHVVIIDGPLTHGSNYVTQVASFQNELRKISGVTDVTSSNTVPGDPDPAMILWKRYGKESNAGLLSNGGVDENFLSFFNIPLVIGRNFQKDMPSESNSILISENGLRRLGFASAKEALGQRLIIGDWDEGTVDTDSREIIGVFKDYRLQAFIKSGFSREDSEGLFLSYKNLAMENMLPNRIAIRVLGRDVPLVIRETEAKFYTFFPESFFNWYFLDAHTNKAYAYHQNLRHQIVLFTALAIFIACLGLLGSTRFMAFEKVRELGIRKILGANWNQLGAVLIKSTAVQIAIAALIGIPVGYLFVEEYLNQYTLRVGLEWWYFVVPFLILPMIFLLTIAPILYRAVKLSPVEALK